MSHACRKVLALIIAVSAISEATAVESGWERLIGADLHTAFSDMELADDVHFSYRFHSNGYADGTEMGKQMKGKWHTTAKEFCWRWAATPEEECHVIKRSGNSVRAYRNGMEVWSGNLTKLPK